MFGQLNHLSATQARQRADDLLERFALTDTDKKPVSAYSGGMRRRLDLAASLIVTPRYFLWMNQPLVLTPMAGARCGRRCVR